jgi:hypothetical protein
MLRGSAHNLLIIPDMGITEGTNRKAPHTAAAAGQQKAFVGLKNCLQLVETSGERGRIRTCDPLLKRALLYQLSYAPTEFNLSRLRNRVR